VRGNVLVGAFVYHERAVVSGKVCVRVEGYMYDVEKREFAILSPEQAIPHILQLQTPRSRVSFV